MRTYLFSLQIILLLSVGVSQDWEYNPADFALSMTFTSTLNINNEVVDHADYKVGVFVGDECRGFATPIYALDNYLYFITVYANQPGEDLEFRVFTDGEYNLTNSEAFIPNGSMGQPDNPYAFSGYIGFDFPPVIYSIYEQEIEIGNSFSSFDLDDFIYLQDEDNVTISISGNEYLSVTIANDNTVTITPVNSEWTGNEAITFTITDNTDALLSASTTAIFTIWGIDNEPALIDIPNQTVGAGGTFAHINLSDYLIEEDGDVINWEYTILPQIENEAYPSWEVNASDYELSMTFTAIVNSNGIEAIGNSHVLGAFVGNECRGTATSLYVLGHDVYFLTVYANSNNDEIKFKFYNGNDQFLLPSVEVVSFEANAALGDPEYPYEINSARLLIDIQDDIASISIVDTEWTGSETVSFRAVEPLTLNNYEASDPVVFTVLPDHNPVVSDIPNQTIEGDGNFTSINLNDYLTEVDGDDIVWTVSGNTNLDISIIGGIATISFTDFIGFETVTFTATDQTESQFFSVDEVTFTVLIPDNAPEVTAMDSQLIGFFGMFDDIDLNNHLTEIDGHDVKWSYAFDAQENTESNPNWNVNASDYELSMTITATVEALGVETEGFSHSLGAFSNGELRGVTTALPVFGKWMYFLTIYANGNGEEIKLKFFDDNSSRILPVNQSIIFSANTAQGEPENPLGLKAGAILVDIDENDMAGFTIVDPEWHGVESISFTATDQGTLNNYSASNTVTLTIIPDHMPVVEGIENQITEQGIGFNDINLNDFLLEVDDDPIQWSSSGNTNLSVNLTDGIATITPLNNEWLGNETIFFTATDQSELSFSGSQGVIFSILPLDHAPSLDNFPDQEIEIGQSFTPINLNDNIIELDGDDIAWEYDFPALESPLPAPTWNINPAGFELSMTITASVKSGGDPAIGNSHILGAFSNGELRGVATAIDFAGNWVYFMTIYSNTNGQEIKFKFFDDLRGNIYPTSANLTFSANSSNGIPDNPYLINAGFFLVDFSDQVNGFITAVDPTWTGSSALQIIATDVGSLHEYSATTEIFLTVNNDTPVITAIPSISVEEDSDVFSINLEDYVSDIGTEFTNMEFAVSGNNGSVISFSNGLMSFNLMQDYFGTETLTLTATDDDENNQKSSTTEFTLIVTSVNDMPQFNLSATSIEQTEDFTEIINITTEINHPENESNQVISFTTSESNLVNITLDDNGNLIITAIENANGEENITITANDGQEEHNIYSRVLAISISAVNDAPEILSSPIVYAYVGSIYQYQIIVEDVDGDDISFSFISGPEGMVIEGSIINWSPLEENAGQVYSISYTISDGVETITDGFDVTVNNGQIVIIDFQGGNNLVSFPGELEDNNSINFLENILNGTSEVNFILGQGLGIFNTNEGWSGNLVNLNKYSGYWVNYEGDEAQTREISYSQMINNCEEYGLSDGNNLVSFKWGEGNIATLEALGGEQYATENFNFILGQGLGLFKTIDGWSGNLVSLQNSKGYWLNGIGEHPQFAWGNDNCANPQSSGLGMEETYQIPEEYQFVQSTEQAFYLIEEIDNAENGDIILAYCNDVYVGSGLWNGKHSAIPVMGKDLTEDTDGFCEIGDTPEFTLIKNNGIEINLTEDRYSNKIYPWSPLGVTSIEKLMDIQDVIPEKWKLSNAYPNPFNPETTIKFGIPETLHAMSLQIFDLNGRLIETLIDGHIESGYHTIKWNAVNHPSGVYIVNFKSDLFQSSQKIVLMK